MERCKQFITDVWNGEARRHSQATREQGNSKVSFMSELHNKTQEINAIDDTVKVEDKEVQQIANDHQDIDDDAR